MSTNSNPKRLKKNTNENKFIEAVEAESPLRTLYALSAMYAEDAVEISVRIRRGEDTPELRAEKFKLLQQVQKTNAEILRLQEKAQEAKEIVQGKEADFFEDLPTV